VVTFKAGILTYKENEKILLKKKLVQKAHTKTTILVAVTAI